MAAKKPKREFIEVPINEDGSIHITDLCDQIAEMAPGDPKGAFNATIGVMSHLRAGEVGDLLCRAGKPEDDPKAARGDRLWPLEDESDSGTDGDDEPKGGGEDSEPALEIDVGVRIEYKKGKGKKTTGEIKAIESADEIKVLPDGRQRLVTIGQGDILGLAEAEDVEPEEKPAPKKASSKKSTSKKKDEDEEPPELDLVIDETVVDYTDTDGGEGRGVIKKVSEKRGQVKIYDEDRDEDVFATFANITVVDPDAGEEGGEDDDDDEDWPD